MTEHPVQYVYVVERAEDGAYWAYVPDLPGCSTTTEKPEEVHRLIIEAVELYLSHYRDRQLPPPAALTRTGVVAA